MSRAASLLADDPSHRKYHLEAFDTRRREHGCTRQVREQFRVEAPPAQPAQSQATRGFGSVIVGPAVQPLREGAEASMLKIKGSEIQQRYAELMMLAGGAYSLPLIHEAMDAGWQGDFPGAALHCAPLAGTYFNMRKTTIYGGSNEVQRNIIAQTVLG